MLNLILILQIITILSCLPLNILILNVVLQKIKSYKKGVSNNGKNQKK